MVKVEDSPHFEEIIEMLSKGKSPRKVSDYLKNEYGEYISYGTLYKYKKKNIKIEELVEAELNRRAEADEIKKSSIKSKVDIQENVKTIENSVAETIADNMAKVAQVAANFVDDYNQAKRDAADENIKNVTHKDVANLSLQANKIFADYFKQQENNTEVNIDNNLGNFVDESEVMRFINESEAEEPNSK